MPRKTTFHESSIVGTWKSQVLLGPGVPHLGEYNNKYKQKDQLSHVEGTGGYGVCHISRVYNPLWLGLVTVCWLFT